MDGATAWRLLYNALSGDEAGRLVAAEGDARLVTAVLGTRSVMV